jgi:DNA-binding winged helix-turn-helix (wHTH) protein
VLFLFENCALDTDRRELRHGAVAVPVEPQVFDLLAYLIKNRERVVSKDDLVAAIWGGRIVAESTLTSRINSARCAIGDSGAEQRLIKTLARKGVRFVGAVREEAEPAEVTAMGAVDAAAQKAKLETSLADKPSIAVLPFANLSGDPQQDYFSDGITEDIITELSRFSELGLGDPRAIQAFSTRARRSIFGRLGESWARGTYWRGASGGAAIASA